MCWTVCVRSHTRRNLLCDYNLVTYLLWRCLAFCRSCLLPTHSVRALFNTVLLALPALINVSSLLLLVFFVYAVVGMQMFAKVRNMA